MPGSSGGSLPGSSPGGERLPGQPDGAGAGGPVRARGPAGAAVMGAAARVTSRAGHTRKVRPGAAVRHAGRDDRRGAAALADHRRGGAGRRRTRHRSSGAAPTAHPRCPTPRTCPARTRPAPGTALDSPPAAGPAGPAARVQLQHGRPHIPRRHQQPQQPPPLPPRDTQPYPRGAMHHPRRQRVTMPWHVPSPSAATDKPPPNTPRMNMPIYFQSGPLAAGPHAHPRSCASTGTRARALAAAQVEGNAARHDH
jgi:hypothetical protein